MANNLGSNVSTKVAKIFLTAFENARVISKATDTRLFTGENGFTPEFGATIYAKRPHDYAVISTAAGDISGSTKSSIIAGRAGCTVQNYITVATSWTNYEEALQLEQLEEILAPMATRAAINLETTYATFLRKNLGLAVGTPGTAATTWEHVATAGAFLNSAGVPMDAPWYYIMNPFTQMKMAGLQNALLNNQLTGTSWERAQIPGQFGGLTAMTSNALSTFTNGACSDRAGTLSATPDVTYVTAKDTMTQSLALANLSAGGVIKAGEVLEVTGRYRNNIATKNPMVDATGAQIKWRAVVTADVTLNSSGAGTVVATGPGIFETVNQYNTTDSSLTSGDVVTILGTSAATVAPNLFFHKQAATLATVKLPKLSTWDTVFTTKDGISIRVTKYSNGDTNTQNIRFDILPAFGIMNPLLGGLAYGS